MNRARVLASRLRALVAARNADADLDAEMRAHLELLADEHRRRGLPPDAARAAALRDFGSVGRVRELYRQQRGVAIADTVAQDLRYAVRVWRRSPGFSLVVVAVLALGIGANTAMFTLVDALLFRPLPGRAADLVGVFSHERTRPDSYRAFSYPNYADLRDAGDTFDALLAHAFTLAGTPAGDTTRRTAVEAVSSNFFSTLGVTLAAGRPFTLEEERPGAGIPVAIVRYDYWKNAGFDSGVLGRTVVVNAKAFTIVGVAPEGFAGTVALFGPELWVPLGMFDAVVNDVFKNKGSGLGDRSNPGLLVAGRLKAGVTHDAANARLDAVSRRLERAYPEENRDQLITVRPLSRLALGTAPASDAPLAIAGAALMPLSGAVLLIACLNIANMFLARGSGRRKEIAIRLAVGGGRRRIVRQLLTEASLLAVAGAGCGLAIGMWTMRAFAVAMAPLLPVALQLDARPDLNVLLAATAFTVASTLAFGLAPALTASRLDVVADLKHSGGDAGASNTFGARSWLVVGQIAASVVLIAIGLSVAVGAIRATAADPGFRYDRLLLVNVDAAMAGYGDARGKTTLARALDAVRRVPGVEAAAMASIVPFGEFHEGRAVERAGGDGPRRGPTYTLVSADYFKALGLPVLRGREFTDLEASSPDGPRVAIIDERLARHFFADVDPLGQQLRLMSLEENGRHAGVALDVVGIVPTVRDEILERTPAGHLYVPISREYRASMFVHVRAAAGVDEASLVDDVRQAIRSADAGLPILELTPMRRFHARSLMLWLIRAAGSLLSAFGILALTLAAVGVYGVKSYVVAQRTREIGIRVALGARPADVLWLVLRDGARMTAVGLAIGLPIAIGIDVGLAASTNGVLAVDIAALIAAPLLLAAGAALATYLPARRAMRVSPLEALRTE